MEEFIKRIPKAELHLHIEGTFEPELMFEIAKRNHITLKYKSIEEVHAAYHFIDLQSFLTIYYDSASVLLHEQDFYDLAWAYLLKAKQQNIRHAEIFFDPQTHTQRGVEFSIVVRGLHHALQDAKKELGISAKLIMCFLRDLSEEQAIATLKQALPFKESIVAVGLDSAEVGNPPTKFEKVYAMAHREGFLAVAHAGEEGPPEYIYEALDVLNVKRIDHGVRCMEDLLLVQRLGLEKIPLTVCPLSNIKLRVFKTMAQHPLKRMLDAGLCVTINSDDPAYFGGYVNENIIAAQKALNLSHENIFQMEKNAFQASFISESEKQKLINELEKFYREIK